LRRGRLRAEPLRATMPAPGRRVFRTVIIAMNGPIP
jgi:hypothetical protein